jgi:putative oxidoreductase
MDFLGDLEVLVGRILIAVIFVWSGLQKVMDPAHTAQYMVSAGGFPPSMVIPLLWASVVIELGGATLLILGVGVRLVAFILFLWMIPATLMFHVRHHEMLQVMKNLCMMGGILALSAYGAGRFGLDRIWAKRG